MFRQSAAVTLLLAASADASFPMISPVKADETVTFFTSAAWPSPDEPGMWLAEVRGIIYEDEQSRLLGAVLKKLLRLDDSALTPEERVTLKQRLALFTVDCERGKALQIVLGGQSFDLPKSGPNGHFRTTLRLPDAMVAGQKRLTFTAVLRDGDKRRFAGEILPQPDTRSHPLVISDVDDTIKLSEVRDRAALRLNTFCRPFRPVPGMAEIYRQWETRDGAQFHYLSGSPWQLYRPLEEFVRDAGFPAGAWHLKPLRLKDPSTLRAFLGPQHEYKTAGIRALMERWPHRPIILVGDTGEQDPEIFGDLARRWPDRIQRIVLRRTNQETAGNARLAKALEGVSAAKCSLFSEAKELYDR